MSGMLKTDSNLADPDAFYEKLILLHDGLSEEQSRLLNAKLILLLANQVGDEAVLDQPLAAARAGIG